MDGARLRRAAASGILAIGASEPVLMVTFDAVVLALRNHQVRVRVVLVPGLVAAVVDPSVYGSLSSRVSSSAKA